jgi:aminopeptidase N
MLRSMMWDSTRGDSAFRSMMQDYVKEFANQSASTEDFKSVVEKHMTPAMNLDGNARMDWFFNEWVYGAEIPSYRLEYSLSAEKGGKCSLKGRLTQSGVSPDFKMIVPLFADLAGKKVRIGHVAIRGNTTQEIKQELPEAPKQVLLNVNHDVLTDREEVKFVK